MHPQPEAVEALQYWKAGLSEAINFLILLPLARRLESILFIWGGGSFFSGPLLSGPSVSAHKALFVGPLSRAG